MKYEDIKSIMDFVQDIFPEGEVTITINHDDRNYYRSILEKLDDCMFVELVDKLKVLVDLNEFDQLLDKEELTEEETDKVNSWISYSIALITEMVTDRMESLQEILDLIAD